VPRGRRRVVDEIRTAGGKAVAIRADVSREDEVQAMFRKMFDAFGTIHILVNNAGPQRDTRFVDMTLHDWEFVSRSPLRPVDPDPVRPDRRTGRHRPCGGLARLGFIGLRERNVPLHRRGNDALPGVPPVTVACSRSDDHWRRERRSR
jgi:NAD(P)-dependent dehydrogenase (short-subunit alcohol dehydrogenase family)